MNEKFPGGSGRLGGRPLALSLDGCITAELEIQIQWEENSQWRDRRKKQSSTWLWARMLNEEEFVHTRGSLGTCRGRVTGGIMVLPPQKPQGNLSSWVMDLKCLTFTRMRSRVNRPEEGSVLVSKACLLLTAVLNLRKWKLRVFFSILAATR